MKPVISIVNDPEYIELERTISAQVSVATDRRSHVFTTDAKGLWEIYLGKLPVNHRQHYNCHACRKFIEKYGGLVLINENGLVIPAFWGDYFSELFRPVCEILYEMVKHAKVTGVYYHNEKAWGTLVTEPGQWTHLSGYTVSRYNNPLLTPPQGMAEKKEDYIMLSKALSEIPVSVIEQAVGILEIDVLDRSEKALEIARWFLDLKRELTAPGKFNSAKVWYAVATAPPGWCHIRSSMIGTLLEDLMSDKTIESVKASWNAKMHPLQYQRPTVLKEGTIKQANEVIEKMGATNSLKRRYAKLEEITNRIWEPDVPVESKKEGRGVFDHLKKEYCPPKISIKSDHFITWRKFKEKVLPSVTTIKFLPDRVAYFPFVALVTAVDPTAPNMLSWNNTISWYMHHPAGIAHSWNINGPTKVTAITSLPCHWGGGEALTWTNHSPAILLLLEGCKDISNIPGGGLFPDDLKSEYHGIRSAIEAHWRVSKVEGIEEASACGLVIGSTPGQKIQLEVHSPLGTVLYNIDRLD